MEDENSETALEVKKEGMSESLNEFLKPSILTLDAQLSKTMNSQLVLKETIEKFGEVLESASAELDTPSMSNVLLQMQSAKARIAAVSKHVSIISERIERMKRIMLQEQARAAQQQQSVSSKPETSDETPRDGLDAGGNDDDDDD